MAHLDGKVAIITGAASGIGKDIAKRFAVEGAKVVIADLQLPAAQATANEISKTGGVAMGVAMDVSDESAVEAGGAGAAGRVWGGGGPRRQARVPNGQARGGGSFPRMEKKGRKHPTRALLAP